MANVLDTESLKMSMTAGSKWAVAVGARVAARRTDLSLTVRQVATVIDVPVQTIYRVESGDLVARDYLRLALGHALVCDSAELFAMPTRAEVAEYMDVAA